MSENTEHVKKILEDAGLEISTKDLEILSRKAEILSQMEKMSSELVELENKSGNRCEGLKYENFAGKIKVELLL